MRGDRWLVAATLVLLAACSTSTTTGLEPPRSAPPGRPQITAGRWGPVVAPRSLVSTARAYYRGAGPAPEDEADGRPTCDLLLPTRLAGTSLTPTPLSRFNVLGEFVVQWSKSQSLALGLTLTVLPAGDPADRSFLGSDADLTVLSDGSQIRRTPSRPRAALVRILTQSCEYEVAPGADLSASDDDTIMSSLRLVFAP